MENICNKKMHKMIKEDDRRGSFCWYLTLIIYMRINDILT